MEGGGHTPLEADESASRALFVLWCAFHLLQSHRESFSAREMAGAWQLVEELGFLAQYIQTLLLTHVERAFHEAVFAKDAPALTRNQSGQAYLGSLLLTPQPAASLTCQVEKRAI